MMLDRPLLPAEGGPIPGRSGLRGGHQLDLYRLPGGRTEEPVIGPHGAAGGRSEGRSRGPGERSTDEAGADLALL
jgi:hypothetical protein